MCELRFKCNLHSNSQKALTSNFGDDVKLASEFQIYFNVRLWFFGILHFPFIPRSSNVLNNSATLFVKKKMNTDEKMCRRHDLAAPKPRVLATFAYFCLNLCFLGVVQYFHSEHKFFCALHNQTCTKEKNVFICYIFRFSFWQTFSGSLLR